MLDDYRFRSIQLSLLDVTYFDFHGIKVDDHPKHCPASPSPLPPPTDPDSDFSGSTPPALSSLIYAFTNFKNVPVNLRLDHHTRHTAFTLPIPTLKLNPLRSFRTK